MRYLILLFYFSGTLLSLSGQSQIRDSNEIPYDSLRTVLEEIYDVDQEVRRDFVERTQRGDTSLSTIIAKMNQADSVNQIQVEELLTTYGWLPQSKVGQKAAGALFLVIQHSDLETMRRYLPVLKKAVEEGEASATSAALMEDRVLMYEGKKQLYGTQASGHEQENGTTKYFIWPIENPEEVNNLRAEVGFGTTVEENAARLNATYNPNEELPQ